MAWRGESDDPGGDDLLAAARAWHAADPDPVTRAEMDALIARGDHEALSERFAGGLAFGTSGLRAPLGCGPRRMNRLVVRRVAAGVVAHLRTNRGVGPTAGPTVVVAHDARHGSARFARDAAAVVAALGGRALLFDAPTPTPVLAWATRELGADAGLVVTASHNPPPDNGVKVYLDDGAQPVPPEDAELAATIEATSLASVADVDPDASEVKLVPAEVVDAYIAHVARLVPPGPREVRLVHTALHGVGWTVLRRTFDAAGFAEPRPVASQRDPDPDFPTVPYPNPEEPGALDAAIEKAEASGAAAVLANDPDADRLGVVVPAPAWESDGGWRALSGNQIGWLLADHMLRQSNGEDRLVVTTFETSRLVQRLAADASVVHVDVPTGFKWIARAALAHPELRFVFGYEEALGYAVSDAPRDKDGIAAALVVASLLAQTRQSGQTVWDRLAALAGRVGHHATATRWARLAAPAEYLRAAPPTEMAGVEVLAAADLTDGRLGHPVQALVLDLVDGARLVVRPSGTEPKLKVYAEVVTALADPADYGRLEVEASRRAAALADELLARLTGGR